jgi:hypothetical protein
MKVEEAVRQMDDQIQEPCFDEILRTKDGSQLIPMPTQGIKCKEHLMSVERLCPVPTSQHILHSHYNMIPWRSVN